MPTPLMLLNPSEDIFDFYEKTASEVLAA